MIFLDGSTTGNIEFIQECTANAGCMMNNAVESVLEALQEAKQSNKTEASMFPNWLSVNLNSTDQEVRNQVEQILNSTCTADIEQQQTDNMVYAKNSTTGNISFRQNGNARANCVMTNSAVARANIQQKGDQSNTISAFGLGGILGLIILVVIIVVIIGAVRGKKPGEPVAGGQGGQQSGQGGGGGGMNFGNFSSMMGQQGGGQSSGGARSSSNSTRTTSSRSAGGARK